MKKEYHLTITRKDRIYLTAFVLFLLGWELIKPLMQSEEFLDALPVADATPLALRDDSVFYKKPVYPKSTYTYQRKNWNSPKPYDEPVAIPAAVVPIMDASVQQLIANGFSGKTAHIIRKYIDAGGVIYDDHSLMKIYSMDSAQLLAARSYITYPSKPERQTASTKPFEKRPASFDIGIIDLNETTAEQLDILPGIGPVLAERILKYRTSLGGFVRREQLLECYGITPEVFEQIKNNLTISHSPTYININSLDAETFVHPYLDKRMLRMIVSYIKNHGPLTSVADLRKVYPPNPGWCDKVIPYVKFE